MSRIELALNFLCYFLCFKLVPLFAGTKKVRNYNICSVAGEKHQQGRKTKRTRIISCSFLTFFLEKKIKKKVKSRRCAPPAGQPTHNNTPLICKDSMHST